MRRPVVLGALLAWGASAAADGDVPAALARAAGMAGLPQAVVVSDLRPITPDPSALLAPPSWLRGLQAQPLQAPKLVGALRDRLADAGRSPTALLDALDTIRVVDGAPAPRASEHAVTHDGDPLALAMRRLRSIAGGADAAASPLPADVPATRPLRASVADMLQAIVDAELLRRRALADVPARWTPPALVTHLTDAAARPAQEGDLRLALARVDHEALAEGMRGLVAATERLARTAAALAPDVQAAWQWQTPWGPVVIDTTGTDNTHVLSDPLLVVDTGGNDRYVFASRSARNRIAVVLDMAGDDRYEALTPGSDAAAGLLGYGVLWDARGDDRYQGAWLAQASAVMGAALLVDGGGDDRYDATGLAQGYALAGLALLADLAGADQYTAATHAQGSAGPGAVAVLFDAAGDDRYMLRAEPVVLRSSQLPDRNVSMGQGAGRGWQGDGHAPALAGGVGVLVDLAGDDHYSAQVFAQGAGYYFGVGALLDGAGADRYEAAWYAQAAAAHAGAGVLLDEGSDDDRYSASHSTSLGAAHDGALAYFQDGGGNDRYLLGDLGMGAAQDASVAVFVDAAGDDVYVSGGCHVLGVVRRSHHADALQPDTHGLGVFLDLAYGTDRFPSQCPPARIGRAWGSAGADGTALGWDAP